jgi:hypothetical protein
MKMWTPIIAGVLFHNFLEINQPKMNHPFPNGTKT